MITLTVDIHSTFITSSDNTIRKQLKSRIGRYLDILSVTRPLFSGRYIIRLKPKTNISLEAIKASVLSSFYGMGFSEAQIVGVSKTDTAVAPGGLQGLAPVIGAGISDMVRPLLPLVLLGFAFLIIPRILPAKKS